MLYFVCKGTKNIYYIQIFLFGSSLKVVNGVNVVRVVFCRGVWQYALKWQQA
jgi:hypothetical protein